MPLPLRWGGSFAEQNPLDETPDRHYAHDMSEANNLPAIADRIRETLKLKNAARDAAVNISRELIRFCSLAIRAAHRDDWDAAERLVDEARRAADELGGHVRPYPDLYFTGYTQDAFKERSEEKMAELRRNAGTVFLVSHAAQTVEEMCTRAIWLDQGRVVMDGPAYETAQKYRWWSWNIARGNHDKAGALLAAASDEHRMATAAIEEDTPADR